MPPGYDAECKHDRTTNTKTSGEAASCCCCGSESIDMLKVLVACGGLAKLAALKQCQPGSACHCAPRRRQRGPRGAGSVRLRRTSRLWREMPLTPTLSPAGRGSKAVHASQRRDVGRLSHSVSRLCISLRSCVHRRAERHHFWLFGISASCSAMQPTLRP